MSGKLDLSLLVGTRFEFAGRLRDLLPEEIAGDVPAGLLRANLAGTVEVGGAPGTKSVLFGCGLSAGDGPAADAVLAGVGGAALVAATLGQPIDLSALPAPVGPSFPRGQVALERLGVAVASAGVTGEEIAGLQEMVEWLKKAPAPPKAAGQPSTLPDPGKALGWLPAAGLEKGAILAAALRVGGDELALLATAGGTGMRAAAPGGGALSTASPDGVHWFKVQKTFGPVHVARVGAKFAGGELSLLLEASLQAAGLSLSLDGLEVTSALELPPSPRFDLHGLGLAYQNGPIEIGGAFLRQETASGVEEFLGTAVVKTEELGLSAIGSYSQSAAGDPSLFLYALLDQPLGGPAFFFVTGLAAGFGFNRALVKPPIAEVASFPLVAEAVDPASAPSIGQSDAAGKLTAELDALAKYVPARLGESFLTAGVKFTSFEIIDSFALLIVSFGTKFEVEILGLSTLRTPPDSPETLAEVTMALEGSWDPEAGFVGIQGQLTPASYIFSSACRLTGGFAFYGWLSGDHAGDFVQTIGGYHPSFRRPSHYPVVPRLGFDWRIDEQIEVRGSAYFALTPSLVMAGGTLRATWHSGPLAAWFDLGADFLIGWKPYHYDATLQVGMGVSYTFEVLFVRKTISVDVGAELHLWGPPFTGHAHIHLWIVSFDVSFGGAAAAPPGAIGWGEFRGFLPKEDASICSVRVKEGLLRTLPGDEHGRERWVVNPKRFVLAVGSAIPVADATKVETSPGGTPSALLIPLPPGRPGFGIGPMGVTAAEVTSSLAIIVTYSGAEPPSQQLQAVPITRGVPAALWGEPPEGRPRPAVLAAVDPLPAVVGFELRPAAPPKPGATRDVDRGPLLSEVTPVPTAWEWGRAPVFEVDAAAERAWKTTLPNLASCAARDAVLEALGVDKPGERVDITRDDVGDIAGGLRGAPRIGDWRLVGGG